MQLTPQQQKIIDHLSDGKFHCMASGFFMKDDRKRISELNDIGFEIVGFKCDRRCGVKHSSRILMRKLKSVPEGFVVPLNAPPSPVSPELVIDGIWQEKDPWTGEPTDLPVYHEIYATT